MYQCYVVLSAGKRLHQARKKIKITGVRRRWPRFTSLLLTRLKPYQRQRRQ
ncbi:hypothetical protein LTSEADE_2012 [Salmonella enterica subsp. enterica serovar Adelaide str. A4-669]|uniref:Uncharacterized protein n=1 Tax=Salmonella enterica subsp. enterica serovar Adelaide str. A4-669 TaxID=913063 RepID=A0A6C8GP87_SALET|nr:hypothetical protein LTSEADE_2012 [Salmonella enterica subsp. enterica serovar Adelaide str. A4-669]